MSDARLAVVESKIRDIEEEQGLTRKRLHDLETDQATLHLLVENLTELRRDVKDLLAFQASARALASWNKFLVTTVIALASVAIWLATRR